MTIQPATTPARAARRQLLRDRFAEYLTEHGAKAEHAESYARDLQVIVDELGFTLPAALDDPPSPPTDACPDGPGRREFREALAALAARRT